MLGRIIMGDLEALKRKTDSRADFENTETQSAPPPSGKVHNPSSCRLGLAAAAVLLLSYSGNYALAIPPCTCMLKMFCLQDGDGNLVVDVLGYDTPTFISDLLLEKLRGPVGPDCKEQARHNHYSIFASVDRGEFLSVGVGGRGEGYLA